MNNSRRILLVDDDQNARITFGRILKLKGYDVDDASCGSESLNLIKKKSYNLVFVDLKLPDISGLELITKIKSINDDIIIIMMTAYASLETSIEAVRNGAYFYVLKPLNIDDVLLVMEKALEKQRMSLEISRLLKEKEILLKEVHHRIKNNMSTLMSIFELHAYTLKDKSLVDALQDASSRVRSICTLYDKLYCSEDFEEVSIKNYLETLVDQVLFNFPASSQIKLKMEFKDFKISARMSFNLGIIVNEILTNTMKYAFNGRNSGTITISAFRKGGDAVITIQDDGVGIPEDFDIAKSTGFGMRLVRMMSQNIQGTIKAERNNGTKFTLEFSI